MEVVDPRTLSPLDMDTIIASVQKTSRAVVAQEGVQFCGFAAEIAAAIQEQAFDYLDAPSSVWARRSARSRSAPPWRRSGCPARTTSSRPVDEILPARV